MTTARITRRHVVSVRAGAALGVLVLLVLAATGCSAPSAPPPSGGSGPGSSAVPSNGAGITSRFVESLPHDSGSLPGATGPAQTDASGRIRYTVVRGDYARAIAARFGMSVARVRTWVGTKAGKGSLHPGQVLHLTGE